MTRHYYRYLKGEETSTNPVATLYAWTGALRKNGENDNNKALVDFASRLENAVITTLEQGFCTKDLFNLYEGIAPAALTTADFLEKVRQNLDTVL